jgi:hypothetical protein
MVSFLIVIASIVYTILGSNTKPWVYVVFMFIVRTLEVLYAGCALFLARKAKPMTDEDRIVSVDESAVYRSSSQKSIIIE